MSSGRLLEFVGHKVLRVNHVGDWGTQFGMLIEFMKEKYPDFQQNPPNLQDLTTFYRDAKIRSIPHCPTLSYICDVRFDVDPDFKKRSQMAVVELQSNDDRLYGGY